MSCGVGHRCGSDLVLLGLWLWPVATAAIGPLAWEPPYAVDVVLEKAKRQKRPKKKKKTPNQKTTVLAIRSNSQNNTGDSSDTFDIRFQNKYRWYKVKMLTLITLIQSKDHYYSDVNANITVTITLGLGGGRGMREDAKAQAGFLTCVVLDSGVFH